MRLLRKLVLWDSATETDLAEIVSIINDWRETAAIVVPSTPASQHRARKKGRPGPQPTDLDAVMALSQYALLYDKRHWVSLSETISKK